MTSQDLKKGLGTGTGTKTDTGTPSTEGMFAKKPESLVRSIPLV